MKNSILYCLSLLPFSAYAGTPPVGTVDIPALVEKVDQGVVSIQAATVVRQRLFQGGRDLEAFFRFYGIPTERVNRSQSLGSGFVIDNEGYILTNNHVIDSATEIDVSFNDGKKSKLRAKLIGRDKKTDIAILKVKPGPYLKPVTLGNSDIVRVGETVVAIGNPFGYSHTVTAGIISAKNRVIGQGPFDNFLQTDATINFGNSGGPLFDAAGEVIGINTAISASGSGLGFAIPINQAVALLPELKTYGKALRGWLGVLAVTTNIGLVVDSVVLSGPAHKAGFQGGDIIRTVNGKKISERFDVDNALEKIRPGAKITIQIEREGRTRTRLMDLEVKMGEEPNIAKLPEGLL